jgi:hypothetical protein
MAALELLKKMSERGPWAAVLQDASEWVMPTSSAVTQLCIPSIHW